MTDMEKRLFALIDEYYRNAFQPTDRKLTAFLLANGVVVREKGEWVALTSRARCTVCADECWADSALEYNFCPNCGADMRGAVNNG